MNNIKKYEFKQFENHNFIDLKKPDYTANKNINYNIQESLGKKKNKIFFYYPLFNLTPNARRTPRYSEDILKIIKRIYEKKERFITINIENEENKNDNNNIEYKEKTYKNFKKEKQIGIEIMKFFHRHKTFNHLFCIFREQDKEKLFKQIKDINESILILVNNNDKIQFFNDKNEDPLKDFKNVIYLILNGKKINDKNFLKSIKTTIIKLNNKVVPKDQQNYFENFDSIFTCDLDDDNEYSSDSS